MATFAGVRDSFARAQAALRELCGWDLDDDAIRKVTHASTRRARSTRDGRLDRKRFEQADGVVEVAIDAGKVNTDTGWRDVKVAVFSKRKLGKASSLKDWDRRDLPSPSVRTVVAAIEGSESFARRVRGESDRLNVTTASDVTVLGDGAEWIWNLSEDVLPQASGVLDAFHAIEHIADAAKGVWGDGTVETTARTSSGRVALLGEGKCGVERWIAEGFGTLPVGVRGDSLVGLAAYFAKHPTRLSYAKRLVDGRSIGSGLVEGSVKQLVNRRLKQTGARWKVAHVGPLVELAALVDTHEWDSLWNAA